MPTYTPTRLGQSNGAGDDKALFNDIFTAEVRHTFQEESKFIDKQRIRRITDGKGATFSSYGRITGAYHQIGEDVAVSTAPLAEKYIPVNRQFTVSTYVARLEEAMSELDNRAELRNEFGFGLADKYDRDVAITLALGARKASDLAERPGGRTGGFGSDDAIPEWDGSSQMFGADARLRNAAAATSAASLRALLSNAALTLDEDDVPESDRYAALRPAQYHLMVQSPGVEMNRDFAGMGQAAMAYVPMVAGLSIVKTNRVPGTNIAVANPAPNGGTLHGDFRRTVALVWHMSAAGTVQLMDVNYESDYKIEKQATQLVASYAAGHDVLRPEAIRELTTWDGTAAAGA